MNNTQSLLAKRDFLLAFNYAYQYGSFDPRNRKMVGDAEREFGDWLNRKLGLVDTPYGLMKIDDVTGSTIL